MNIGEKTVRADSLFAESVFVCPSGDTQGPPGGSQNAPQIDGTRSKGGPGALKGPSRNRAQISSNFGRLRPPPGGVPRGALEQLSGGSPFKWMQVKGVLAFKALNGPRCYYAIGRVPAPSYGLLLLRSCVVVSSNGVQGGSLPFAGASGRPSPRLLL